MFKKPRDKRIDFLLININNSSFSKQVKHFYHAFLSLGVIYDTK